MFTEQGSTGATGWCFSIISVVTRLYVIIMALFWLLHVYSAKVMNLFIFSTSCNIYILCLCYDVSVRLSVTEVHGRIIANLGFKF